VADGGQMVQTLRTAEPSAFRLRATSSAERDAEAVQRAWAEPTGLDLSSAPSQVHGVLRSSGRPLDHGVRSRFERRLGQDFANVRVHSDESATAAASAVAANAFTVGRHVVFGREQLQPHTLRGDRLLAHELAHVVRQRSAGAGARPVLQREPDERAEQRAREKKATQQRKQERASAGKDFERLTAREAEAQLRDLEHSYHEPGAQQRSVTRKDADLERFRKLLTRIPGMPLEKSKRQGAFAELQRTPTSTAGAPQTKHVAGGPQSHDQELRPGRESYAQPDWSLWRRNKDGSVEAIHVNLKSDDLKSLTRGQARARARAYLDQAVRNSRHLATGEGIVIHFTQTPSKEIQDEMNATLFSEGSPIIEVRYGTTTHNGSPPGAAKAPATPGRPARRPSAASTNPAKKPATPKPAKKAATPKVAKKAATPKPAKKAATPKVAKKAATPKPAKKAPTPKVAKKAATPKPAKKAQVSEPADKTAAVEPAKSSAKKTTKATTQKPGNVGPDVHVPVEAGTPVPPAAAPARPSSHADIEPTATPKPTPVPSEPEAEEVSGPIPIGGRPALTGARPTTAGHADVAAEGAEPEPVHLEPTASRSVTGRPSASLGMGEADLEEADESLEVETSEEREAIAGPSGNWSLLEMVGQWLLKDVFAEQDARIEQLTLDTVAKDTERRIKSLESFTVALQSQGDIAYAQVTVTKTSTPQIPAVWDLKSVKISDGFRQGVEDTSSVLESDIRTSDHTDSFALPLSPLVINAFSAGLQARIDQLKAAASPGAQRESAKLARCRQVLLSRGPHVPSFGFLGGECLDVFPTGKPPNG
jgi:hypothetical protein